MRQAETTLAKAALCVIILIITRRHMKIKKFGAYYVLRIEPAEEILTTLEHAAQQKRIKGAFFIGLGVGNDLVLGYFNARKRTYVKKLFEGEYEFSNLSGNISTFNEKIAIHCHVTISNSRFHAFGGHLFQGTVPATCEIIIMPFNRPLKRREDKSTGLRLLNI